MKRGFAAHMSAAGDNPSRSLRSGKRETGEKPRLLGCSSTPRLILIEFGDGGDMDNANGIILHRCAGTEESIHLHPLAYGGLPINNEPVAVRQRIALPL